MANLTIKVGGDGTGFFALQNKIEARSRVTAALLRALTKEGSNEEIRELQRVASVEEATRRNRLRAIRRERAERRAAAAEALADERRAAAPPVIKPPIIPGKKPSLASQIGGHFAGAATSHVAGFLSIAALSEASRRTVMFGSAIDDLHKTTGASIRSLQEWVYAASKNGATIDDIGLAFKGLAKARDDALGGNAEKLAAFGILGIDEGALKTNSIDQSMRAVADAFNKNDFGADTEPLAEKVMGRGGVSMIATFKDDFRALAEEAQKLNAILSDGTVKELANIANEVVKIIAQFRGPLAQAVMFVARAISVMVNQIAAQSKAVGHMFMAVTSNPLTKGGRNQMRESLKLAFDEAMNGSRAKAWTDLFSSPSATASSATKERAKKSGFIPEEEKEKKEAKTRIESSKFEMTADGPTKIGGFIGGTAPGLISSLLLGRQQLSEQQKIARNTQELLNWMKSRNFSVDDEGSL